MKMSFSKPTDRMPDWCEYGDERAYRVKIARKWHLGWKGSPFIIYVPVGFEFESSVPILRYRSKLLTKVIGWFQPFVWIFPPDHPQFLWPAALHDYLLEKDADVRRPFADSQWLDAARSEHAPKRMREYAYLAMRLRMFFKQFSA